VHRVADCIILGVIPQPTEWQRIGNQINAAMIVARTDFVNVLHHGFLPTLILSVSGCFSLTLHQACDRTASAWQGRMM